MCSIFSSLELVYASSQILSYLATSSCKTVNSIHMYLMVCKLHLLFIHQPTLYEETEGPDTFVTNDSLEVAPMVLCCTKNGELQVTIYSLSEFP